MPLNTSPTPATSATNIFRPARNGSRPSTERAGHRRLLARAWREARRGVLGSGTTRSLWALVADGGLGWEDAERVIRANVEAGQDQRRSGAAAIREGRRAIWGAWSEALPCVSWLQREGLSVRAVAAVLAVRARKVGGEWQAEVALTEMQRRLGGVRRGTAVDAAARLEKLGAVSVHRRKRTRRFNEVNVYTLHDLALIEACERRGVSGSPVDRTQPPSGVLEHTTKIQEAPLRGAGLQDEERAAPGRPESGQDADPPDVPEAKAVALAERAAADLEIEGGDLAALAREALALYAPDLAPRAWAAGIELHGQRRAALAALEVARLVCLRDGTVDPIRSPAAYLAGTLRKPLGQCRPEVTLAALDARARPRPGLQTEHRGEG